MKQSLKNTIECLPEILLRNAPSMMRRLLAAIQEAMAKDSQLPNAAYSALLLKMSEPELVREFEAALKPLLITVKHEAGKPGLSTGGLSLSLEPLEATAAAPDLEFQTSTAVFDTLNTHARQLGVTGVGAYNKDLFLTALKNAFVQARIDPLEVTKLMPMILRALNAELVNVYGKLNSVQRETAEAPTAA